MTPTRAELIAAARALAVLVRDEYPDGYSLAEVTRQWGWPLGLTPTDAAAVEAAERSGLLGDEAGLGVVHQPVQEPDVGAS